MSNYPIASQAIEFKRSISCETLSEAVSRVTETLAGYSHWTSSRRDNDQLFVRLGLKMVSKTTALSRDILVVPWDGKAAEWFRHGTGNYISGARVVSRELCQDTTEGLPNLTAEEDSLQAAVIQAARALQNAVNASLGAEPRLAV